MWHFLSHCFLGRSVGNLVRHLIASLSPGAWVDLECKEQKFGPFIMLSAGPTSRQRAWALLNICPLPDCMQALVCHPGRQTGPCWRRWWEAHRLRRHLDSSCFIYLFCHVGPRGSGVTPDQLMRPKRKMENGLAVSFKTKRLLPCYPAIVLLSIYPE